MKKVFEKYITGRKKSTMKYKNFIMIAVMLLILMPVTVYGSQTYISDSSGVLRSSTIKKVESNLAKLEVNTGAQARIVVVKSLDGMNIDDYAEQIAKTSTSTNSYAVFLVFVQDRKNKFLVGEGMNTVFSSTQIDRIASLPNEYFRNNDFDAGILKVGEAIDQNITTKTVRSNNAVVGNVTSKITFIFLEIFILILITYIIRRKVYRSYHNNNDDRYYNPNNINDNPSGQYYNNGSRENVGNTTIINNYASHSNGFMEGVIIGEILSNQHGHDNHECQHSDYVSENYETSLNHNNEDGNNTTSGEWGDLSGTSSWDSSSVEDGSSD
jgi:uncharacterized membrane protein YgcG